VGEQPALLQLGTTAARMVIGRESTGPEHAPYLSHARACIFIWVLAGQPPMRSQLNVVDSCQNPVVGVPVLEFTHLYSILTGVSRSGSGGMLVATQFCTHVIVSAPLAVDVLSTGTASGADGGWLASHTPSLHARLEPRAQSAVDAQVVPPAGSRLTHVLAFAVPCARLHRPASPLGLAQQFALEVQLDAPTGRHALQAPPVQ